VTVAAADLPLAAAAAANDSAGEFHDLAWRIYFPIGIAVMVAVAGLFAAAILRARRRTAPSPRADHPRAEALYALALAAIVALLLGVTFAAESRVDAVSPRPAVTVDVTAYQWQWAFQYAGTDVREIGTDRHVPVLSVPSGETVNLSITSRDVIHAFWIPALRFKRDANPGFSTTVSLRFDREGRFEGRCSEFCGLRHTEMRFMVRVLSPPEFRDWLAARGRAAT
jgi:cytochrome c oxidase subunit 2